MSGQGSETSRSEGAPGTEAESTGSSSRVSRPGSETSRSERASGTEAESTEPCEPEGAAERTSAERHSMVISPSEGESSDESRMRNGLESS